MAFGSRNRSDDNAHAARLRQRARYFRKHGRPLWFAKGVLLPLLFLLAAPVAHAYTPFTLIATSTSSSGTPIPADVSFTSPSTDSTHYFVGCLFSGTTIDLAHLRGTAFDPSGTHSAYFSNKSSPFEPFPIFVQSGYISPPIGTYTVIAVLNNDTKDCNYFIANPSFYQYLSTFYWDGSGGLNNTATRIDAVLPFPNSTIATSSPLSLEAIGFVNAADVLVGDTAQNGLSINWRANAITNGCIDVICAVASVPSASVRLPVGAFSTSSQSFNISTTTGIFLPAGIYDLHTSLDKPASFLGLNSFFGLFSFGYSTIVSTSTVFTVATSTNFEQILLGLRQAPPIATTTAAALSSCIPIPGYFSVVDCVVVLFVPTTRPDYTSDFTALAGKPPFGYFTQAMNLFAGATTTSASTTPIGIGTVSTLLAPLVQGLSLILWFLLLLWIFHRLRNFNFQS